MIEFCLTYDFIDGYDEDAYNDWSKRAIVPLLKSPGIIEFRAHRNLQGSPLVRLTAEWKNIQHWAKFAKSPEWQDLVEELSTSFATNISTEVWGPSPTVPKPLHPIKHKKT